MSLDLSEDYLVWEGLEPVTLEVSRRQGSGQRVGLCKAKRRALTRRELAASAGAYTGEDLVWLLPQAQLPECKFQVKPADVVTDGEGREWTVLEAAHNKLRQTWRLVTRDLVLAYDLRDLITVERAELGEDLAGAAVKREWQALYASVPARVQPSERREAEEHGVEGWEEAFDVWVGRELADVGREDRVKLRDGTYLDVVRYRQAERIDQLPVLECVRRV